MKRVRPQIAMFVFIGLGLQLTVAQTSAFAQTAGLGVPLTLSEAITERLVNNPRIRAALSQTDASVARISEARSGLLPRVDLIQSVGRTTNPMWAFGAKLNQGIITTDDFDPARLNDPEGISNFATTLSVTMPIYDQGKTWIGLSQAKLDKEATTLSAERVRQQVILEVVASYLGVRHSQENLEVVIQALETAKAHLRMVRSRLQSGLTVKSDLLRAEVHIAELEQERVEAQSQVNIARASLNAAIGADVDRSFDLVTPLEGSSATPGSLETWIRQSLENRPDLEQIRFEETMAQAEVKKAKAAHLPGVYLSGSYDINSEDFSETADSYTVGAEVRFNLFSGLDLQSKVREAKAQVCHIQALIRQLELGIEVEVRRAFFQAQSASQRIGVANASMAQAEEGLRIVRDRYENGLLTIVNLLDAEVALKRARSNYLRSLYDFEVAIAQLNLAAGILDEEFPASMGRQAAGH